MGLSYLNGAYANYSYDAASRLLVLDNQTNNGQHKYAYTYDYVGNRLEMTVTNAGGVGIHLYSYDNIYQITEVNYPDSLSYLATDTEFNYDDAGNRSSVIDGSGTCNYTTNNLNQYTAAGPTNFQYDTSGNMTHDANYAYYYDPENRLLQVTKSGGSPPDSLAEALDSGLIFITDGNNGGWSTEGGTWCYHDWDCASGSTCDEGEDWLQTTVQGAGTLKFWWKVSSETWDVLEFYIDDDCKHSISGEQTWAEKTYTITGAGTHTLRWRYAKDSSEYAGEDRGWVDYVQWTGAMEEPDSDDWSTLNYVYDPGGRRIEKKYDGRTVLKYVYDGDHCIAEYDAGGNLRRKYIYGPCTDEPISMIESSGTYAGTYYYHFDALGSVVALTDSDADTVNAYEYDVYGRVGMLDANHPNRLLFTGRQFDLETGLYYYRARYYNPQIGRFLQTDPIGYGDGMNLYAYCGNNATNRLDPTGTASFEMSKITEGDGAGASIRFTVYADDGVTVIRHYDACDIDDGLRWLRGLDDIFTDEWLSKQDGIKLAGDELTWWYLQAINQLGGGFDYKAMEEAGYHIVRQIGPTDWSGTYLNPSSKLIRWSAAGVSWPSMLNEPWRTMRDGPVAFLAHELQHAADQMAGCDLDDLAQKALSEKNAVKTQNRIAGAAIDLAPKHYKIGQQGGVPPVIWFYTKEYYMRPGELAPDEHLPWED